MTPDFTVSSTLKSIPIENRAAASLQAAGRPADMLGTPERVYSCNTCGEKYSQRQGLLRHRRKAHDNPHSCLCCEFKWSRPDQYRTHLEKWHPDVDCDRVLGKPAGSRRRSKILGRDLPHDFSSRQCLMMPPLPEVAKATHIHSTMAYDPRSEFAEPAVTTPKDKDRDARGLEFQRGQLWLARPFW